MSNIIDWGFGRAETTEEVHGVRAPSNRDWRDAFRLLALRIEACDEPIVMTTDVARDLLEIADMDDEEFELTWRREQGQ